MNKLKIYIPEHFYQERKYVIDTLFTEIGSGLNYDIIKYSGTNLHIVISEFCEIQIDDSFFKNLKDNNDYIYSDIIPKNILWLKKLPWKKLDFPLPIFWGIPEIILTKKSNNKKVIICKADIIAIVFFMLSRWEEINKKDKLDNHGRFDENKLFTIQKNINEIPIVEYSLLLIKELLSYFDENSLKLKSIKDSFLLSSDVDHLRYFKGFKQSIKKLGGDLIKRKIYKNVWSDFHFLFFKKNTQKDPYDNFDFLIDLSLSKRFPLEFNLLVANSLFQDFPDSKKNELLLNLISKIKSNKITIGFHPGYGTNISKDEWLLQLKKFEKLTELTSDQVGGRQHFLRFNFPYTMEFYEEAGLRFDSSFGFAYNLGFRCGCCHQFTLFNPIKRKVMRLKEKPFVIMDSGLVSKKIIKDEIQEKLKFYHRMTKEVNGQMILIWHNSSFNLTPWKDYKKYLLAFLETVNEK